MFHRTKLSILQHKKDAEGMRQCLDEMTKNSDFNEKVLKDEVYCYLLLGKWSKVKDLAKEHLEKINYDINAEEMIVNYELSMSKLNEKVHKERLGRLLKNTTSHLTKTAVCVLLDKLDEAMDHFKKSVENDRTNKYVFLQWPVLDNLRNNSTYMAIYESL